MSYKKILIEMNPTTGTNEEKVTFMSQIKPPFVTAGWTCIEPGVTYPNISYRFSEIPPDLVHPANIPVRFYKIFTHPTSSVDIETGVNLLITLNNPTNLNVVYRTIDAHYNYIE